MASDFPPYVSEIQRQKINSALCRIRRVHKVKIMKMLIHKIYVLGILFQAF